MDTYMHITELKPNNNNATVNVYQIQPQKNLATIMQVGILSKVCDINMHTFQIENKYTCHIINKIYDIELLQGNVLRDDPSIQILSIIICLNNNDYPFAHISINFHFEQIKDIQQNLSTKDNIIPISGSYSLSLHLNNGKMVYLESDYKFIDKKTMVTDLCEYITDPDILELLEN